jgi:protein TonB
VSGCQTTVKAEIRGRKKQLPLRPPWLRISAFVLTTAIHFTAIGGLMFASADMIVPPGHYEIGIVASGEIAFEPMEAPVPLQVASIRTLQDTDSPEPQPAARPAEEKEHQNEELALQQADDAPAVPEREPEPDTNNDKPEVATPATPPRPVSVATAAAAPQIGTTAKTTGPSHAAVARYAAIVSAEINRRKHYPAFARARNERGVVIVSFVVGQRGDVVKTGVTKSSGSTALDDAATTMVKTANLPSPPMGQFHGNIEIAFRVRD